MEIRQLEPRDKIITFFSEIKGAAVESAIKDIARINAADHLCNPLPHQVLPINDRWNLL